MSLRDRLASIYDYVCARVLTRPGHRITRLQLRHISSHFETGRPVRASGGAAETIRRTDWHAMPATVLNVSD